MKRWVYILIIIFSSICLSAQIGFEAHVIDDDENDATTVKLADADGDGDLDVFYCSWIDGIAGWYENIDGHGDFSSVRIIDQGEYFTKNIDIADVNSDGFVDVILSISSINEIRWYRNDGQGNFSEEELISSVSEEPYAAKAYDIDNDGDLDILTASYGDNTIAWHENIDGEGTFGSRKVLVNSSKGAYDVMATDIDKDGDLDVFYTSVIDNKTAWIKNLNGNGSFGQEQILTMFTINPTKIQAEDLDLDGDLDVFVTAQAAENIVYWENLDGGGQFSERQYIDIKTSNANVVETADIDSDGDNDIILANWQHPSLNWQENYNGKLSLGRREIIKSGDRNIRSVDSGDIDGDGDVDFAVASDKGGLIQWIENTSLMSNVLSGSVRLESENDDCNDLSRPMNAIRVDAQSEVDTFSSYSLTTGYYQLYPQIGSYITSLELNLPSYFSAYPSEFETTFDDIGNIAFQDFCIRPTEDVTDVSVILDEETNARPGFLTTYNLFLENNGSVVESGEVTIEFDETKFSFVSSNLPIIFQSSDQLVLRYEDLDPLTVRKEKISFKVHEPPVANFGEEVDFNVSITPIEGDLIPDNNTFTLHQILRGSYDPNDIRVLEGSKILKEQADDFLHYVIRFQNTGTASAIHVRVENTLDPNLDWSTFTPLDMSHEGRINIINNKEITFDFQYINLPDSVSNEPASHGSINYKIKPKAGFSIGDSIQNKADIFFDFNLPIRTNTVVTQIYEPAGSKELELLDAKIYPNPVSGILNVDMASVPSRIIIYDVSGRELLCAKGQNQIDLKHLKSGFYIAQIFLGDMNSATRKFIISN